MTHKTPNSQAALIPSRSRRFLSLPDLEPRRARSKCRSAICQIQLDFAARRRAERAESAISSAKANAFGQVIVGASFHHLYFLLHLRQSPGLVNVKPEMEIFCSRVFADLQTIRSRDHDFQNDHVVDRIVGSFAAWENGPVSRRPKQHHPLIGLLPQPTLERIGQLFFSSSTIISIVP